MHVRTKVVLALCACTAALAASTATAGATVETLGFMHPGEMTAVSAGAVTLTMGELTVRCNVTLEGELQEDIAPSRGEALGSIASAAASGCEGGEGASVAFLSTPWSLTYDSFSGEQPEGMTAVAATTRGVAVSIRSGRFTCLYRGDVGLSFALSESNPYPVGALSALTESLSLVSGEGCARTASIRGSFERAEAQTLVEIQMLELTASPNRVTRAMASQPGGIPVTFTPRIQTVRVVQGGWRDGANGWTTDITTCLITIVYPAGMCQLTVTATGTAGNNMMELYAAGVTLVGQIPVGP